jgi:hypothetical protein
VLDEEDIDEDEDEEESEEEEEDFFVKTKVKKSGKPINGKKTIQKEPSKVVKKPMEKLVPVAKKADPALKKVVQPKKAPPKKMAPRPMRSIMKKPIVVKKSAPASKKPQPARRIIAKPKKK